MGPGASPVWVIEGHESVTWLGRSVASAGDVNGDGFSDVIISQRYATNLLGGTGLCHLYLVSSLGLSSTPGWEAYEGPSQGPFCDSVASAGDVNGDGFSDVVIGAKEYNFGSPTGDGAAFAYYGSPDALLAAAPVWNSEGDQADAQFGVSVASAGDVDADSYDDIVVGAWMYDNGEVNEGRAFLYSGSPAGPASTPSWTAEADQVSAFFGSSVASAGDVNGDGYSDVIVGAPSFDDGETNEGQASLYLGSASGLSPTPSWTGQGDPADTQYGLSVAGAGDIDGDGSRMLWSGPPCSISSA